MNFNLVGNKKPQQKQHNLVQFIFVFNDRRDYAYGVFCAAVFRCQESQEVNRKLER